MFTIRTRLTLVVLALIAALMGLFVVYLRIQLEGFVEDGLGVQVRAQVKPVVDAFATEADGRAVSPESLEQLATDLTSARTGALVLASDGRILARPAPGTIGTSPPAGVPIAAVARAASGETEVDVVLRGADGPELVSLVPVPGALPERLVIALATPLEPADRFVDRVTWAAGLGAVTAVGLAALLTPVLVRRSLLPLRRVAAATERVAGGDLTQRVNMTGPPDEVLQLADRFDAMTAALERAFGELAAAEARSRQFVADASHELRTPLTAVAAYTDLLIRDPHGLDTGERLRRLASQRRQIARIQRMVEGLLELARLDADPAFTPRLIALREMCEAVVEQVRPVAADRVLRVHGAATVTADEGAVRQILLNLLSNAIRHTDSASGRIDIRLEAAHGTARLAVVDNGTGMDERTRLVAFERFARGDAPVGEGSGLGLAIVASIVRALAGEVCLTSDPGDGTTVLVRLPAAQQATPDVSGTRRT